MKTKKLNPKPNSPETDSNAIEAKTGTVFTVKFSQLTVSEQNEILYTRKGRLAWRRKLKAAA